MQLQNMCKKGAQILQKNTPKGGETWQLKWHLNDGEKNDDNNSRHITSILKSKESGGKKRTNQTPENRRELGLLDISDLDR